MNEKQRKERAFLDHFHRSSYHGIQLAGYIALVIYDLHVIWDYIATPQNYPLYWTIRLGIVTPLMLIALKTLQTDFGRKQIRFITLTTCLLVTLSVIVIHSITHQERFPPQATGVTLTMLFCLTCVRMLRREALMYVGITTLIWSGALYNAEATFALWINNLVSIIVCHALGMSATVLMEGYARRAFADEQTIKEEQARADHLLFNTFPTEVALRLKTTHGTIADSYSDVTVLFADIEGFTAASTTMSPEDLVHQLNDIFSHFDRLTLQYGCEKIKTIGDAYMAVCGVPNKTPDHAERIARLAIAMKTAASSMSLNAKQLSLRIGIHSGPVVAGVIGESRFAFDLWGDTVNTANRMESTAPANTIQMSSATKAKLGNAFAVARRGVIDVKGKGTMETWTLLDDNVNINSESGLPAAS